MSKIVVGLDIGTTKIACFIGQASENGKVKILGYGKTKSVGVERGVVRNILEASNSIVNAVAEASAKANNFEVKDVYIGIAGQHIKSIQNRASISLGSRRIITEEDIARLISEQYDIMLNAGEEIIHVLPQVYYVDGDELSFNIKPVGVLGNKLEANVLIITANSGNLYSIKESVKRAGLTVKGVILEPIASGEAVLDSSDKGESGACLVDIGGGTTDIAIFKDDVIYHTAVIPMAGDAIDKDIMAGCSVVQGQAESLKIKFGSCLPENVSEDDIITVPGCRNQAAKEISMKNLAHIIHARVQLILEQVEREIELSGMKKKIINGVVITGGGAKMNYIDQFTEYVTAMYARIGVPNEHLESGAPEEISHPMYATGIGLLLLGIKEEAKKVNEENVSENKGDKEPEVSDERTENSGGGSTSGGSIIRKIGKYLEDIFIEKDDVL